MYPLQTCTWVSRFFGRGVMRVILRFRYWLLKAFFVCAVVMVAGVGQANSVVVSGFEDNAHFSSVPKSVGEVVAVLYPSPKEYPPIPASGQFNFGTGNNDGNVSGLLTRPEYHAASVVGLRIREVLRQAVRGVVPKIQIPHSSNGRRLSAILPSHKNPNVVFSEIPSRLYLASNIIDEDIRPKLRVGSQNKRFVGSNDGGGGVSRLGKSQVKHGEADGGYHNTHYSGSAGYCGVFSHTLLGCKVTPVGLVFAIAVVAASYYLLIGGIRRESFLGGIQSLFGAFLLVVGTLIFVGLL